MENNLILKLLVAPIFIFLWINMDNNSPTCEEERDRLKLQNQTLTNSLETAISQLLERDKEIRDNRSNTKVLVSSNSQLKVDVNNCQNENEALKRTIARLRADSTALAQTVERQRDTIKNQKKRIDVLVDSLRECNKVLANVKVFMNERQSAKNLAQLDLNRARTIAEGYGDKSEEDKENIREQLWEIYSKYNLNAAVKDCGPFTLTASDDLKDGWSHYYTAMILSEDIGKIFNKLDTNYCNKVYEMNTKLLNEVGLALVLAKNDYDLRNVCYGLLEKLISQVIDEKRCWGGKPNGEPSAVGDLRDIGISYRQGDYASAMGKYNKGYRLLELDEVKRNSELVAEVKYCVGSILLWNLGDISSYHGLSAQGSWFERNYSRRTGIGQILLIEAAKISPKESVVRKNALVVTRKKY